MGVYPNYGGVEKVSTILANEFIRKGHRVGIVSFEQPHPELAVKELNPKVGLYYLKFPVSSVQNKKQLTRIVHDDKIDYIINQWCVPWYVARLCRQAMRGTNCKLISVHHNLPTTNARIKGLEQALEIGEGRKWINRLKLAVVRTISRISLRYTYAKSHRYIVLSPSFIVQAKQFLRLSDGKKILSIGNPITIPNDIPSVFSSKKMKEILYVGRIEYNQKRSFRLVTIWQKLSNEFPDWKLTIVGDGPDREDLQNRIEKAKLERITIEGFQNPIPYYQRASILLLVSDYEGFPLVIPEAMSKGIVPVVYGSFSAIYDIIESSKSGFITNKPYSDLSICQSLSLLMKDESLLNKMQEEAYKRSNLFTLDTITTKWYNLFDCLDKEDNQ